MTSGDQRNFLDLLKNDTMSTERGRLLQAVWDTVIALRSALSKASKLEGEALAEVERLRAKLKPTACRDCGEPVAVRPRRLCQMCAS